MVSLSKKVSTVKNSKKQKVGKKSSTDVQIMTLEETAKYLRVPKKLLEEQIMLGYIPGQNIGGEWRFSKTGLDNWLANKPSPRDDILSLAGVFANDETSPELLEIIKTNRKRLDAELRQ